MEIVLNELTRAKAENLIRQKQMIEQEIGSLFDTVLDCNNAFKKGVEYSYDKGVLSVKDVPTKK